MKKFCVMPWYSREINLVSGKESVCCWLEKDVSRKELQYKFLSDEKPHECSKCWHSEDNNIESRRQMENRFLDFKMERNIELLEQDAVIGVAEHNIYQIFLGSICNGTCVTCGSGASSAWRSLQKNVFSIRRENQRVDQNFDRYLQSIDWQNAKRFNLLGGEPLLILRSFDILQKLLEVGNTDCRISFVTNGSVVLSRKQIELIKNFSDVSCCVSIDGTGKTFEYIRYPLSWQKTLDNLAIYQKIFSEIVVSFTVSNLNYHERDDIISWFNQMGLLYIENYVIHPEWFNYQVTPNHPLWGKFVKEIKNQDNLKNIRINDYLPDIAKLIEKHE
jgi:MoaA/NifB/PqqE/SkfB family radical SAM enzyme